MSFDSVYKARMLEKEMDSLKAELHPLKNEIQKLKLENEVLKMKLEDALKLQQEYHPLTNPWRNKYGEAAANLKIATEALEEIGKGKLSLDATLVANEALKKIAQK